MKLLNKSLRYYVIYAVVVLFVSAPLLFFSIQHVVIEDADESLLVRKVDFISKLEKMTALPGDSAFNLISTGIELVPIKTFSSLDTIYVLKRYDSLSKEFIPYRILESHIQLHGKPYSLKLKDSLVDADDLIESIVRIVLIVLLSIITGLYLINRYVSKYTWKPFYALLRELSDFRIDKKNSIKLPVTNIEEFTDLNKAINELTEKNSLLYQSQKEFTENASHEMQTPLAVLQAKIDLLMQTTPLTEEQSELISDITEVNQRMSYLNKNMLLLTKIENNQFTDQQQFSLVACIETLLDQYQFQAAQRGLIVKKEFLEDLSIRANRFLFELMAGNLLNNAIRHNIDGGILYIIIRDKSLTICNTSDKAGLDTSRMFTRFDKQHADTPGLGLGLQLANKIAGYYSYKLSYKFVAEIHHFQLSFFDTPSEK